MRIIDFLIAQKHINSDKEVWTRKKVILSSVLIVLIASLLLLGFSSIYYSDMKSKRYVLELFDKNTELFERLIRYNQNNMLGDTDKVYFNENKAQYLPHNIELYKDLDLLFNKLDFESIQVSNRDPSILFEYKAYKAINRDNYSEGILYTKDSMMPQKFLEIEIETVKNINAGWYYFNSMTQHAGDFQ